jgi:cell fate (sporulation/competence/biofilm development) regulator YlbF (YheA/YmcA/DUF963 family)
MAPVIEQTPILQKTRELCETIVSQPDFADIKRRIDSFMADESTKNHYQSVVEKNELLQQKQQTGEALDKDEVSAFEKDRESLLNNPVAKDFMDAQQEMHDVQQSVNQYVSKTFELARLPTEEDFSSGSCGSGCGCH